MLAMLVFKCCLNLAQFSCNGSYTNTHIHVRSFACKRCKFYWNYMRFCCCCPLNIVPFCKMSIASFEEKKKKRERERDKWSENRRKERETRERIVNTKQRLKCFEYTLIGVTFLDTSFLFFIVELFTANVQCSSHSMSNSNPLSLSTFVLIVYFILYFCVFWHFFSCSHNNCQFPYEYFAQFWSIPWCTPPLTPPLLLRLIFTLSSIFPSRPRLSHSLSVFGLFAAFAF